MSIRVDMLFPGPLSDDQRVRMLLAAAALPEVRRTTISPDGRRSAWYAGEMPLVRVEAALAEAGVVVQELRSGLAPESEAVLAAPPGERFRPIGR